MNGPHPSASAVPWLEDITHAYARYLGAVLGLRPNLFVRQGNLISWLEEEPPARSRPAPSAQTESLYSLEANAHIRGLAEAAPESLVLLRLPYQVPRAGQLVRA